LPRITGLVGNLIIPLNPYVSFAIAIIGIYF